MKLLVDVHLCKITCRLTHAWHCLSLNTYMQLYLLTHTCTRLSIQHPHTDAPQIQYVCWHCGLYKCLYYYYYKTARQQTASSIIFARLCQCALPLWDIGTTWRIRLNLRFLILCPNRVHNPNGKSIGSAVFAQFMAKSPYILQWAPLSPKLSLFMGDLDPRQIYDSLGPSETTAQTASRSVQPFLHRWP